MGLGGRALAQHCKDREIKERNRHCVSCAPEVLGCADLCSQGQSPLETQVRGAGGSVASSCLCWPLKFLLGRALSQGDFVPRGIW